MAEPRVWWFVHAKTCAASVAKTATSISPKISTCRAATRSIAASPDGSFVLIDGSSKNGTFVRIRAEHELAHGDYLFLGKQLLRVEITG